MSHDSNCAYNQEDETELRRGPWTLEEDTLLIHYVTCHGEGRWNSLAKSAGLKRNGKSCRLRWLNYLKPEVKRGNLTPQEQVLILELHSKWGNKWSKIAQHIPGRTDNEIKNYWRTRVQKQARQLNIESTSEEFHDAVRMLWTPRLLQQMEQQDHVANVVSGATTSSGNENDSYSQSIMQSSRFPSSSSSSSYNLDPMSSTNSSSILQFPNTLVEDQTSPYNICFDHQNVYHPSAQNGEMYYQNDSFAYDMTSPLNFQMAESNWVVDDNVDGDVASTGWNTDELWQFR